MMNCMSLIVYCHVNCILTVLSYSLTLTLYNTSSIHTHSYTIQHHTTVHLHAVSYMYTSRSSVILIHHHTLLYTLHHLIMLYTSSYTSH